MIPRASCLGLTGSLQVPCPPQNQTILTGVPYGLARIVCALSTDCDSGNSTSSMPWTSSVAACSTLSRVVGPTLPSTACWLGVR